MIAHATTTSGSGKVSIFGPEGYKVQPAMAALANGLLSHSFELDSLRMPSAGMHAGASIVPCAFGMGQEVGASGKDVITAFTAGIEVLTRIAQSSNHSSEDIGFHNPGINGGFGGGMACLLYTSPSPRDRTRSRMPSSIDTIGSVSYTHLTLPTIYSV